MKTNWRYIYDMSHVSDMLCLYHDEFLSALLFFTKYQYFKLVYEFDFQTWY